MPAHAARPCLLSLGVCVVACLLLIACVRAGSAFAVKSAHYKRDGTRSERAASAGRRDAASTRKRKAAQPNRTHHRAHTKLWASSVATYTDSWRENMEETEYEIVDAISSQAMVGEVAVSLRAQTITPILSKTEFRAAEKPIPSEAALTSVHKLGEEAE
eukprot:4898416-Prymnesium_polylepis.1